MSLVEEKLVGTWRLVEHGFERADGTFVPTGDNMRGQIMYGSEGALSVLITMNTEQGDPANIIAYSGTFSVKGNVVSHHMYVANKSSRIDSTEDRIFEISKERLILSTSATPEGKWRITWQRFQ
ncbi:MAG: hypothetical protein CL677_09380 [Bdellovibrionaceae bacterium]|nr:hypothetical protein [Pseudobdellovibrionaceae bacterium]|tara:strand:- start:485 stop:856 length:372 start_codon:yes stop_codon:yes gene_type:complete